MRRPAALTFAALFLFSVTFVHGQAAQAPQNPQPPKSPEESQGAEKPQSSEKAQSPTEKPQSAEKQQNPFDAFKQFSATLSGGLFHFDKMKIYRSGNLFRAEWAYENETRISNLAKRRGTFIRPTDWVNKPKLCGDMDRMDIASYPFFAYTGSDFNVERVPGDQGAEKETIEGHSCKVENYTVKNKEGGTLTAKMKLWEAEDLNGFPIRMEIDPPATKKFTLYYSNVSLDPPDPKLFQVPANCPKTPKKAASPSSKSKTSKPVTVKPSDKSPSPPQ